MKLTIDWLRDHLDGDFTAADVVATLNRIGHEVEGVENPAEKLAGFAEASRIAIGMTTVPADLVAPGEVHSHGQSRTRVVMAGGGKEPALAVLAAALDAAGLPCAVDPDAVVAIWEKVAFNVALNSLCAVTRRTVPNTLVASWSE